MASQSNLPTTKVWVQERQGNVEVIRWKSQYWEDAGWTPQKRCETVSGKFQDAYASGKMKYLVASVLDQQVVVCAAAHRDEPCKADFLFTLKPKEEPQKVLDELVATLTKGSGPPYRSGPTVYISLDKLFKDAELQGKQ